MTKVETTHLSPDTATDAGGKDGELWVPETINAAFRPTMLASNVLVDMKTEFQHLVIFENETFGRVLMLDGVYQLTDNDEFVYHEMMAHVPLMSLADPQDVLIVGGGDGGVLREVLRHPGIKRARLCEIDQQVIDTCRRYFPANAGNAFDDPRSEIIVEDASKFLDRTNELYDAIIIDTSEPVGPNEVIFQNTLVSDCKRQLKPGGILAIQTGITFVSPEHISRTSELLRSNFADATVFLAVTPTYAGGHISLGFASDDADLKSVPLETLRDRLDARAISPLKYYTPDVHRGAFALPPYVSDLVGS